MSALAGCASASTTPGGGTSSLNGFALGPIAAPSFTPQPDVDGRVHLDGFSFVRPPTWLVYPGLPLQPTLNPTVGYVSTVPVQNRCARTDAGAGMVSETCGQEIDRLTGPHGGFARWRRLEMPGQRMASVAGTHSTVGGRDARWSQAPPDARCLAWGGTTLTTATVLREWNGSHDAMLELSVCLVSADEVSAVRAMVDSLQFDPGAADPLSLATPAAPAKLETTTVGDLTFLHDVRWLARPYKGRSYSSGGTYTYVSTEPVDDGCAKTSDGFINCAGNAVAHLRAHGVFATWSRLGFPGLRLDDVAGEKLTVDGRPATWTVPGASAGDTSCAASGATTSALGRILLWSQDGGGDELALLFVCLQSPEELPAVKAMFESAQFAGRPVATEAPKTPDPGLSSGSFAGGHVTFRKPADWKVVELAGRSTGGVTYGFVSNRKVHDPCHRGTCGAPLDVLDLGAVVARWETQALPGTLLNTGPAESLIVGGAAARWHAQPMANCWGLGPATYAEGRAQVSPGDPVLVMSACVQAPEDVPRVKAMFASTQYAI